MHMILAMQIAKSAQYLQRYLRQNPFINLRLNFSHFVQLNDILQRTGVHQLKYDLYRALLKVSCIKSYQKVAFVAVSLLLYQVAKENANVVHQLLSFVTVVGVYCLSGNQITFMATGIFRGKYTPLYTTQAAPLPNLEPTYSEFLEIGINAATCSPVIVAMPSGPICSPSLINLSPSEPG